MVLVLFLFDYPRISVEDRAVRRPARGVGCGAGVCRRPLSTWPWSRFGASHPGTILRSFKVKDLFDPAADMHSGRAEHAVCCRH